MCVKHVGVRDTSLSEENKIYALLSDIWDWSWQELARFDLSEMMRCIYSTSSKVLVVGHSQGTIMSLAAPKSWLTLPLFSVQCHTWSISLLNLHLRVVTIYVDQQMGRKPFGFNMRWLCWLLGVVVYDFVFDCGGFGTIIPRVVCFFFN